MCLVKACLGKACLGKVCLGKACLGKACLGKACLGKACLGAYLWSTVVHNHPVGVTTQVGTRIFFRVALWLVVLHAHYF